LGLTGLFLNLSTGGGAKYLKSYIYMRHRLVLSFRWDSKSVCHLFS